MIIWLGTLLTICSMLALVPEEVGVAKERLVMAARRLFHVGANIGAVVAIVFGILAILAEPMVLEHGWLHVKILLVLVLLAVHIRIYLRINRLQDDASKVTRGEFSMLHGIVSALLLGILILVILKPF